MSLRRLIVMRHAKSSWSAPPRSDHERPLTQRGRKDAARVGNSLLEAGWVPNLVLSSDAQRTRETFAGLRGAFPGNVEVRFLSSFYHVGPSALAEELPLIAEDVECLLLLGHNPGWERLVAQLSDEDVILKTATAALLSLKLSEWKHALRAGQWALEKVIYPKELQQG